MLSLASTMISYFQANVLTAIAWIAYYGLIYLGVISLVYTADSAHNTRIKDEAPHIPSQESLSTVSDPILQAESLDSSDDVNATSDKESSVALSNHDDPVGIVQYEDTPVPYKHDLWPSPRPVNFVRAILDEEPSFKVNGRLAHVKAVDILAERAFMSRRQFLRTNPITYSQRFMKGMNALYLLKGSIDRLEYMLREETYKQELRRIENGKNYCPLY